MIVTIARNAKIRDEIAGLNNSSGYWETKTSAILAVCEILGERGLCLDDADWAGDSGSALVGVRFCHEHMADWVPLGDPLGYIHFSWYRMPSGRYGFTVYIT
jgi:hypothetical protein